MNAYLNIIIRKQRWCKSAFLMNYIYNFKFIDSHLMNLLNYIYNFLAKYRIFYCVHGNLYYFWGRILHTYNRVSRATICRFSKRTRTTILRALHFAVEYSRIYIEHDYYNVKSLLCDDYYILCTICAPPPSFEVTIALPPRTAVSPRNRKNSKIVGARTHALISNSINEVIKVPVFYGCVPHV